MLPRCLRRGASLCLRSPAPRRLLPQIRTLVAAPKPGDGPLMDRRADRELPDISTTTFRWTRTLPLFLLLVGASSLAIFNYQKSTSPVVAAVLYALRTSPQARELLGDEIYFAQAVPWIRGEMNTLQGRIDIRFRVRGTKQAAVLRFVSRRPSPRGVFETLEWSIEPEGAGEGGKVDLLEGGDPFGGVGDGELWLGPDDEEEAPVTRGFRK